MCCDERENHLKRETISFKKKYALSVSMEPYRGRERERPYCPKARNNDGLYGKLFLDGS